METYERIKLSRNAKRPTALDYIYSMFDGYVELHGDRAGGDDHAVVGGLAWLDGIPVTVIGIEKGHTAEERIYRRFGCAVPQGYRKALRFIKQAEKFHRPVINFVDTQGAYPGAEAEADGIGYSIARSLYECITVKTPILSIMIGEGGSGGALALGIADEVWILRNAYYSVIAPEACANILYKENPEENYSKVTKSLKLFSEDLRGYDIVERIIDEPEDFSIDNNLDDFMSGLKEDVACKIKDLMSLSSREMIRKRYKRYRKYSVIETQKGGFKMPDYSKDVMESMKKYMSKETIDKLMKDKEAQKYLARVPEWSKAYNEAKASGKLATLSRDELEQWLRENVSKEAADGFKWFMDGKLAELCKKGMGAIPTEYIKDVSKYIPEDLLKEGFKKYIKQ